jgi:hypothetical protein
MGQVFSFVFPMIDGIYTKSPNGKMVKMPRDKNNKKVKVFNLETTVREIYLQIAIPPRIRSYIITILLNDTQVEKINLINIKPFLPDIYHHPIKIDNSTNKISILLEYVIGGVIIGGLYVPHVENVKYNVTINMCTENMYINDEKVEMNSEQLLYDDNTIMD